MGRERPVLADKSSRENCRVTFWKNRPHRPVLGRHTYLLPRILTLYILWWNIMLAAGVELPPEAVFECHSMKSTNRITFQDYLTVRWLLSNEWMRVISFPGPSWLSTITTTGLLYSISSTPEVRDKPHPRCPWASWGRTPCCLWVRCSGWRPRQLKPSLRLVTGTICPYCIASCRNTVSSIRRKYCAVLVHTILDGFLYSCKCRGKKTSSVPRQ